MNLVTSEKYEKTHYLGRQCISVSLLTCDSKTAYEAHCLLVKVVLSSWQVIEVLGLLCFPLISNNILSLLVEEASLGLV